MAGTGPGRACVEANSKPANMKTTGANPKIDALKNLSRVHGEDPNIVAGKHFCPAPEGRWC